MNLIGINPNYLRVDELIKATGDRVIAVPLDKGSFYEVGLKVTTFNGGVLVTDYTPVDLDVELCLKSPIVVYRQLKFPNGIPEDLLVTYYYVDSTEADRRKELDNKVAALDSPRIDLDYRFIQGTSTTAVPVTHEHNFSAIYKLEQVIASVFAVMKHNGVNGEDLLDSVLANYQPSVDNRLITVNKDLVGSINELLADIATVNLSSYQLRRDSRLITQAQTIVGAISELQARIETLSSGGRGSLDMKGELVGTGLYDLNSQMNGESKVWVVNSSLTLKGNFGDGLSTYPVVSGDVVYYDAETGQLYVQSSGSGASSKLDKVPGNLSTSATTVSGAVAEVYKMIATMSGIDPTNPLLGIITTDIDLTVINQTKDGFYVIGKDGVTVKGNYGADPTHVLNVGQVIFYTHSNRRHSITLGTAPAQDKVTTGLRIGADIYDYVQGLNHVYSLIQAKLGSDSDAIEFVGGLSSDTDLTGFSGSESWIIYSPCSITGVFAGGTEVETRFLYTGDVIYRKRSEGVLYVNGVGGMLVKYLDQQPVGLNTGELDVVKSLQLINRNIEALAGNGSLLTTSSTIGPPVNVDDSFVVAVDGIEITAPYLDGGAKKLLLAGQALKASGVKWDVVSMTTVGVDKLKAFSPLLPTTNKRLTDAINNLKVSGANQVTLASGDLVESAAIPSPDYGLMCNGKIHKTADYPVLGELLGNTYGGDGVTTFAMPTLPGARLDTPSKLLVSDALGGNGVGWFGTVIVDDAETIVLYPTYHPTKNRGYRAMDLLTNLPIDIETGEDPAIYANLTTYSMPMGVAKPDSRLFYMVCGQSPHRLICVDPLKEVFPNKLNDLGDITRQGKKILQVAVSEDGLGIYLLYTDNANNTGSELVYIPFLTPNISTVVSSTNHTFNWTIHDPSATEVYDGKLFLGVNGGGGSTSNVHFWYMTYEIKTGIVRGGLTFKAPVAYPARCFIKSSMVDSKNDLVYLEVYPGEQIFGVILVYRLSTKVFVEQLTNLPVPIANDRYLLTNSPKQGGCYCLKLNINVQPGNTALWRIPPKTRSFLYLKI